MKMDRERQTALGAARLILLTCLFLTSCALRGDRAEPGGEAELAQVEAAETGGALAVERPLGELDFYRFHEKRTPPAPLLKKEESVYVLGPGDRLSIEVVDRPMTREEAIVMSDGMLYYDVADGVMAAGKTLRQVEAALSKQLQGAYKFTMVTASLVRPASRNYTILGQVTNPGSYPLTKPTTLLAAIAEAGGSGSDGIGGALADLPRSIVIRDSEILPVDFSALVETGDMRQNIYLKPGDYILMPAQGQDRVHVLGAVNAPSAVPYSSHVTLIGAIASARGLAKEAYPKGVLVVRGSFSDPQFAAVDLKRVMLGKSPDLALLPGDIVWVPQKPWQKLSEYVMYGLQAAASSFALRESSEIFFSGESEE